MKIVLDSNVAVEWDLTEPLSDKTDKLRIDFQNGIIELHSPDVFRVEVAHALTRAERQLRVPLGDVLMTLRTYTRSSRFWAGPSGFRRKFGSGFTIDFTLRWRIEKSAISSPQTIAFVHNPYPHEDLPV